jgi:thiamine-monophosphate kinase
MPRRHPTENSLLAEIERIFPAMGSRTGSLADRSPFNQLSLGIGDDAALFRPTRGCETILTCDWFLEGTHFLREKHPPDAVGWKCLARALSDIAAMGGTPRCFLLSLALPESAAGSWLANFLRGLRRAAQRFGCVLAGGDTTKRDEILINITVVGEVQRGRALRRDGARAGDLLFVSGRLGQAEQGLHLLRKHRGATNHPIANRSSRNGNNPLLRKHLYPEPRLALGQWLVAKRLATAAMDLSDGLSSDLPRLCAASGVGARIDAQKLPHANPPASSRHAHHKTNSAPKNQALKLALHGGDDYELLFTVPQNQAPRVPASFQAIPLTAIGEITASRKLLLVADGHKPTPLKPGGWDSFR